jgi:hypothetical protein
VSVLRCRPLAMLMLVVFLSGCTTWRPTTLSLAQVVQEEQASSVRITRRDGTRVIVDDPVLRNDSLQVTEEACILAAGGERVGCRSVTRMVALDSVTQLEVRQIDVIATTLAVVAVGIPVFLFGIYLSLCGFEGDCER